MLSLILISIAFLLLSILIFAIRDHHNYFKKRNVKCLKSVPGLGFLSDSLLNRKSFYDNVLDVYRTPEFKDEPFFGAFLFMKPALIIKDPELIKKVLVTDFASFGERYAGSDIHDPLGYNQLILARYPLWKKIRPKFSNFFTNTKLKSAFYLIEKIGSDLSKRISNDLKIYGSDLNIKSITDNFYVEVISSIGFGVEARSLKNPRNEFSLAAESLFTYTFHRAVELMCVMVLKSFTKPFGFKVFGTFATDFFLKMVPQILSEREKSGTKRNDFIDCLLELKKEGFESDHKSHTTEEILTAQIAVFFLTGYETSSITTSFTIYELAKNQEIQKRLRNELKKVLERHDGKLTYEAVSNPNEMPYLTQVMSEILRLYPALSMLDRECINPEGVSLEPFSSFRVPFGMPIFIPVYGLAQDEKYFPNPKKFDPDRFSAENIGNIPENVFIPFGAGPRYCVGERLAWIQSKFGICTFMKDYRVEATTETPKEIIITKKALLLQSEKPLIVKLISDPIKIIQ